MLKGHGTMDNAREHHAGRCSANSAGRFDGCEGWDRRKIRRAGFISLACSNENGFTGSRLGQCSRFDCGKRGCVLDSRRARRDSGFGSACAIPRPRTGGSLMVHLAKGLFWCRGTLCTGRRPPPNPVTKSQRRSVCVTLRRQDSDQCQERKTWARADDDKAVDARTGSDSGDRNQVAPPSVRSAPDEENRPPSSFPRKSPLPGDPRSDIADGLGYRSHRGNIIRPHRMMIPYWTAPT